MEPHAVQYQWKNVVLVSLYNSNKNNYLKK